MKKLIPVTLSIQVVLVIMTMVSIFAIKQEPLKNFIENPVLFIFPLLALAGLIGVFVMNKLNKEGAIFLSSATFIFGAILTTIMAMFPVLLPSTNSINPSLTIQSMKAADYSLEVGLYWYIVAIILVAIYFYVVHRLFSGKLDDNTYGH